MTVRLTLAECQALLRETIRLAKENQRLERGYPIRAVGTYLEDLPEKIEPTAYTITGTPVYQRYNGYKPGARVIDAETHEELEEECEECEDGCSSPRPLGRWAPTYSQRPHRCRPPLRRSG